MKANNAPYEDPGVPIIEGAEPAVVGPLLAEAMHDPRWVGCTVALISGGKSNLTYRVRSDAGRSSFAVRLSVTSFRPRTTWVASTVC